MSSPSPSGRRPAGAASSNGHPPAAAAGASPPTSKAENAALAAGVPGALSHTETYSLLALTAACATVLANTVQRDDGAPLTASVALSGAAFAACYAMIRWLGPTFVKAGIKGVDMSKAQRRTLPECMGAVCAVVYLLALIVFIPVPFYKDIVAATSGGGNRDVVLQVEHVQRGRLLHRFPHSKVGSPPSPLLFVFFLLGYP